MMSVKSIIPALLLSLMTACKSTSVGTDAVNETSISNTEWQMEELRYVQEKAPYFYKRGSTSANNMNYDNDFIKFNNDGTGLYHPTEGMEYPLKWYFADVQKSAIVYTIKNFREQQDLTVHWEQIQLSKKTIKFTEYSILDNGDNSTIAYVVRTARQ